MLRKTTRFNRAVAGNNKELIEGEVKRRSGIVQDKEPRMQLITSDPTKYNKKGWHTLYEKWSNGNKDSFVLKVYQPGRLGEDSIVHSRISDVNNLQ